jgi:uncharacterized Zn finger protein (UPF0148 family)
VSQGSFAEHWRIQSGGKVIEHVTGERLVRMELKYCEACGGLLLRRAGEVVVYCAGCQTKLAELPQSDTQERKTRTRSRLPITRQNGEECQQGTVAASEPSPAKFLPQAVALANQADFRRMA